MTNFLSELIQAFRPADFFDITLISVLIYIVLIWFKAAASRFVLLGIIILGVVYLLARFFNMYLSALVLQAFFAILLIALVIIFQEELRRFFERLSTWGAMRRGGRVLSEYSDILPITHAISELARKKIGVLIIIRGKDPLGRHLEGGFELDGRISEALLGSIFDPNSVGHDGAVVVEEGRISKFGCHLPLSANAKKIHRYGTRHSAALGLSERSDALCIVVSEERGTISLAREEKIEELKDPSELQAALEQFYLEKFPKEGQASWGQWLRENSREKAVAVLLSCGLWFVFVFQTGTLRRDFIVPIEYRNLSSDWVIEEPKRKEVSVTLLGRARAFDLLEASTLKVTLDMAEIKEGTQKMVLSKDLVRRPSSLSVIALTPETVSLSAHQILEINLPVEVQMVGELSSELEIVGINISPATFPIKVPSKFEGSSLKLLAEPIDLSEIKESVRLMRKIVIPEGTESVDDKTPEAEINVEVLKKVEDIIEDQREPNT
jgi:diadenylate cyclase